MRYTQHPSNNHVFGAPARWDQQQLPCGALPVTCTEVEGKAVMVSFWKPDATELAQLINGGSVALWVYGTSHPVVAIGVEPK